MITLAEFDKKRTGTRYDPKKQKYVGYKIDVRIGKKRVRQLFQTRKHAEDYIDDLRLKQKRKKAGIATDDSKITVRQLFDTRLAEIENHSEKARAERVFNFFLESVAPEDIKISEVRTGHYRLFVALRKKEVKPETVNREINPISKAFSSAAELFPKELEEYDPPKVFRPQFKRKRREVVISEKEKDAILANLYAPQTESDAAYKNRIRIGRMFHIAYLLGMAYKEVAFLEKTDYSGTGLTFIRAKTGNPVSFEYLPDEVHTILKDAIADSDTQYVFTHSGSTPKDFYKVMRAAIEDAGLVYGRDNGITFHSARHSFVTNAMKHTDLKTVGSMSGHSDDSMVMRYSHASAESRKKALQAMYGKKDLRAVFEKVRAGKMSYEEFEKEVL